jgi:YggT family protein
MLAVLKLINLIFNAYLIMILINILSSWLPEYRDTKFVRFIAYYTEPYLNIFRRFIPPLGMIDISPIIAILALNFIQYLLESAIIKLF